MQIPSIDKIVSTLNLEPHIEGGYFRQTFKAAGTPSVPTEKGERVILTSIYYLLTKDASVGHFHKNTSHIMHYFHLGDPIHYYLLHPDGRLEEKVLGPDVEAGQELQFVVPGGVFKASKLSTQGNYGYGLIGEAVAPGFEYEDMELAKAEQLSLAFPEHTNLIKQLSKA